MAQYHEDLKERASHGTKRNISDKAKKQIEELQSKKQWTDAEKFIEYLRANFPPKTGTIPPLPEDAKKAKSGRRKKAEDAKKRKKIIDSIVRKLTILYHPDRNSSFGDDWAQISEEISKIANYLYQVKVKGQ